MNEPRFIAWHEVAIIHEISIERFGGSRGVRDEHLIHSALGAAMNDFYYAAVDLAGIAAAYAFHIATSVLRLVRRWCFWNGAVWKPERSGPTCSLMRCIPWQKKGWTNPRWQD